VIPPVGVAGARDRQYTLTGTLATELAIATLVAEGAAASRAGRLPEATVADAITGVEGRLGRSLTGGQREVVWGICTQGRQISLVFGGGRVGENDLPFRGGRRLPGRRLPGHRCRHLRSGGPHSGPGGGDGRVPHGGVAVVAYRSPTPASGPEDRADLGRGGDD
jgi:hypothetical protein